MEEFHENNNILESMVVSVYILGSKSNPARWKSKHLKFQCADAAGPLLIAPLSELFGRNPIYHAPNAVFLIFTIACAVSSDLNMLIGFRVLQGISGSATITMGAGTCADMFIQEERGLAIAIWSMGTLVGPARCYLHILCFSPLKLINIVRVQVQ